MRFLPCGTVAPRGRKASLRAERIGLRQSRENVGVDGRRSYDSIGIRGALGLLRESSSNPVSAVGDVPGHFWMLACVLTKLLRNVFSPSLSDLVLSDKEG